MESRAHRVLVDGEAPRLVLRLRHEDVARAVNAGQLGLVDEAWESNAAETELAGRGLKLALKSAGLDHDQLGCNALLAQLTVGADEIVRPLAAVELRRVED